MRSREGSILSVVFAIIGVVLAMLVVWMLVGLLTGGFLWTDTSFAESPGAFGVVLLVMLIVVVALLMFGMVLPLKMVRARMRDLQGGAPQPALPPPPLLPPPPPAVEAASRPAHTARSRQAVARRERPLRAPGR